MTDALPSDHPSIVSYRVTLGRVGSTNRPQLPLPEELTCESSEYIRLTVDGTRTHAEVTESLRGERTVIGAYANRRMARMGEGTDILGEWLRENGYEPGETVVLDVLTEGYAYGVREPGARVIYHPVEKPNSSLADIAQSLDE